MSDIATQAQVDKLNEQVEKTELANKDLRDQLRSAGMKQGELQKVIEDQKTAITMLNSQKTQLEGTVLAVRSQRDRLTEAEADALVDKHIMGQLKEAEAAEYQRAIVELKEKFDPEAKRLAAMESDLQQVRNKFGDMNHKRLVAEKEAQASAEKLNIVETALDWYVEASNGIKFNILKKFNDATGETINAALICYAYQNSHFYDKEAVNLAEFLISCHKELKDKEQQELAANVVEEVESLTEAMTH